MRLLDRSVRPVWWRLHRSGSCTRVFVCFCRCRGYSLHYIWRCRRCSSSSRTLTSPSWRRSFSHGPDFSAFPFSSPSCRTRSGCPGCAVASSATGAVLSMYFAVLAQRQVPAALCAGWAPGPFIDLSVGSVSGVFCCGLVVVTRPFNDECGNFLGDPDGFSCGGSRLAFGSGAISLSGLQVGEKTIQTFLCGGSRLPFGSGGNSLSGLQVGEKAIQMFLCRGSRLPFGSGAIPFRVCKLAKRRSKRFCAEDRGFLSEAVQFPFGFVS